MFWKKNPYFFVFLDQKLPPTPPLSFSLKVFEDKYTRTFQCHKQQKKQLRHQDTEISKAWRFFCILGGRVRNTSFFLHSNFEAIYGHFWQLASLLWRWSTRAGSEENQGRSWIIIRSMIDGANMAFLIRQIESSVPSWMHRQFERKEL